MNPEIRNESYKEEDAIEIVSDCYTDLAKYVAETRAYCSTVDGLKAVARRTIFAARPYTKKVKSVAIVGDALKHHPHGDGNVYGALVSMTCSYGRFPLFTGKGNFGGLGSRCAAMRYTEACLSDLARLMYMELIDYAEFVEGETGNKEPRRLPALLPYAYLVGAGGIPVGLPGANIPSVDCVQLVDYYISYLKGEEGVVPLPDFGDCIIDQPVEEAREVIKKGHGKLYHSVDRNRTKFLNTHTVDHLIVDLHRITTTSETYLWLVRFKSSSIMLNNHLHHIGKTINAVHLHERTSGTAS